MSLVNLKDISVNPRLRDINHGKVLELAESIELIGLLNPIICDHDNNLLAGAHRLEAHKYLGRGKIEVNYKDVDQLMGSLVEVDENLVRAELTDIQMSRQLKLRDEILEQLGLLATPGMNQHTLSPGFKTVPQLAREMGVSKRTLQRKKSIARNIDDDLLDRLTGTQYATQSSGLLALARIEDRQTQEEVVDFLIQHDPSTIQKAIRIVSGKWDDESKTETSTPSSTSQPSLSPQKQSPFYKWFHSTSEYLELKDRMFKEYQEGEYLRWSEEESFPVNIEIDLVKRLLQDEIDLYTSMTQREYTLFKKWGHIKKKIEWSPKRIEQVKSKVWIPSRQDDYLDLEPEIICVKDRPRLKEDWNILDTFIITFHLDSVVPGRSLPWLVRDKKTGKYLGYFKVASDFMSLPGRDEHIGWTKQDRIQRLNHICTCTRIVPTQPLGFSYVGGKLLTLLAGSQEVEDTWKSTYGETLVGLTTTSLFGGFSQYNNLKYWKKLKSSRGRVSFVPNEDNYLLMRQYLEQHYPRKYFDFFISTNENGYPPSSPKIRATSFAYNKLGIESKDTYHSRGVYFCDLYKNTKDFLRGEIGENDLERRFNNSLGNLVDLWKYQYVPNRLRNLRETKRFSKKNFWYGDLPYLKTWEEVQGFYL